ncbi:NAD-binding protein of Kef-type K+ transporter [Mycolicibacterium madagascariense]|uniref:NAD-binding protein of Kef-type K+ transporter n=1 Tax=Mycolicibacterium madagascariense TaxID=212765 RepID=A0A7I7XD86_9MYCO|nr:potassium channel family protein [Mycolicibacterium madagascariense]MCV7014458.1 NAD-binding protein [Mycolicibacterium madagascariense]BBZ27250.1 NAD-binding protein of Kef-type K+ transporter [Mycolicibacterium madagascariense]
MAKGRLRRRLAALDQTLTTQPDHALVGTLRIPETPVSPARKIAMRVLYALGALFAAVAIVYLDRNGYRDVQGNALSLLDCLYYATVSLSTTGYGDITPFTPSARLINVLVITPLRVAFLIVLIGTTVETLTEASRQTLKIQQWRRRVRDHTVVVGYGTKGKTAVAAMIGDGAQSNEIVIVDTDRAALDRADKAGLVTVHGDANRADVLRLAGAQHATAIVVATNNDPTAVLVTLTARELAPRAKIIASIREAENQHLLRQSGADSVVVSSETAGRLLGMAAKTPTVVEMIEDLLTPDAGFAIAERDVTTKEVGGSARHLPDIVLGVVRGGQLVRVDDPEVDAMELGDRLLYIRNAEGSR